MKDFPVLSLCDESSAEWTTGDKTMSFETFKVIKIPSW